MPSAPTITCLRVAAVAGGRRAGAAAATAGASSARRMIRKTLPTFSVPLSTCLEERLKRSSTPQASFGVVRHGSSSLRTSPSCGKGAKRLSGFILLLNWLRSVWCRDIL